MAKAFVTVEIDGLTNEEADMVDSKVADILRKNGLIIENAEIDDVEYDESDDE